MLHHSIFLKKIRVALESPTIISGPLLKCNREFLIHDGRRMEIGRRVLLFYVVDAGMSLVIKVPISCTLEISFPIVILEADKNEKVYSLHLSAIKF